MNMLKSISIAVFIISLALTGTSTSAVADDATTGTIHFEDTQFMLLLEGSSGHGTLGYRGKVYKFKSHGVGAGGWGGQKISGTGTVSNLKDIADFPGAYNEVRGGAAVAKGKGALHLENKKGVKIDVTTHADGVALSVGVTSVKIELVDDK